LPIAKKTIFNLNTLFRLSFILSFVGVFVFILDFGYNKDVWIQIAIKGFYFCAITLGIAATFIRYFILKQPIESKVLTIDIITGIFCIAVILVNFFSELFNKTPFLFYGESWIRFAFVLTFIREFSEQKLQYKRATLNPAQLFIISFIAIILLGALLLQLPNATHNGISFLDALFTSTSAVCVTGLIVVDTGSYFTEFGQVIIMFLIQVGGLGILTFASYFSYFFKGGSSYENQLSIGEMTNSDKLGEVFSTLKRILIITFIIEFIGALMIFTSLDSRLIGSFFERVYFSAFHAVSAFCNAGFSTLQLGLYDDGFKYNYFLQLALIFLFVMGGLGFPIVVNLVKFTKYFITVRVLQFKKKVKNHKPWVLTLNSRITLITTITLTVVGTILFFFAEYDNSLAEHGAFGKFVTALFGATTPRTAGFNTVDMANLNFSTVILIILLMWIGASPASTGGGIKTSTFAIATLNFISLAKGKTRIEVYRREIADISVRRAFAVISLSLIVIGTGIIIMSIFDSEKDLLGIAFECFSAYSTVGLSVGITADLSSVSKFVIIVVMFIGRVSMLSIMIAVFRKVKHKNYRYPSEEITIN
jgi:Trk-type K+ transport system membrane component